MNKAQASVELLVILAVSMVLIGIILVVSNEEINTVNLTKANYDAQYTADKIAKTAEEVFSAGTGTKKQIFVSIPSGIDKTKTGITNNTVRLNINGTDIISEAKVELTGSIPTEQGGHWIWITAYEGYVLVGDVQIETDKGSVYSTIAQDATAIENIKIINNTSGNATVTVTSTWSSSEVSLSLSENSFVVGTGSSYGINLNFSSGSTAVGNYVGELVFDIDTVDGSKRIVVPLTVEVIISGGGEPLMIFPDSWNLTIDAGTSDSNTFQVCNTTDSKLTNIVFTSSSGDAGEWVDPIASIDSLEGNTCQEITVTINVPIGGTSDTGTVTASDGTNSDFISLDVSIAEMADNFYFDWSTVTFNIAGTRLRNWTMGNASSSATIVISRIIVWDWNESDQDNATLRGVRFNGNPEEWSGNAGAGEWMDNTDFSIPTSTNYTSGNRLRFNAVVNDDGEYFRITFEFLDGSTYTTPVYYSAGTPDSDPPIIALESPANSYSSTSYDVTFEYNVNDAISGIANCELLIDGGVDQTDTSITEGVTQSFSKTFSSNGSYVWAVRCTDDYVIPNTGASESRTINISTNITAPVVALESPIDNYTSGTYDIDFEYNVTDAESGIAFCELIIDGAVDQTDNTIAEGVTQTFSKTFESNGNYTWDVTCTDDSENSNTGTSGENRSIRILSLETVVIAEHTFPDTSWSSGTGWLAPWNYLGDTSITNRETPHSSPNHLRLRRDTGYAERSVDLSSYPNARLEFWAKINGFEVLDRAYVRVSSDHTNWTTIKTFTFADSDNQYHFYSFNLSGYNPSGEFWIAFDAGMNNRRDYFYIDDINVVQGGAVVIP